MALKIVPFHHHMQEYLLANCQAQPQLHSTSTQTKAEVSLISRFRQATHPAARKSSDMELCLNSFSARELKFGTDTHYTNLIKII